MPSTFSRTTERPLRIWRFRDGKPGHENQTAGLVQALERRCHLQLHEFTSVPAPRALAWWLGGRYPPGAGLPAPDLILGAGHATHLPMLAARRAHGGRVLVLMKPSLPCRWFDLCLVPEHDRPPARPNLMTTCGVLTPVRPGVKDPRLGLILLGGPSRHHDWPPALVLRQVRAILAANPRDPWEITDSRRTPPGLLAELAAGGLPPGSRILPWRATPPGWLAGRLAEATRVWVSEDSVSMLYEALSAGAAVGLIQLPRRSHGRVAHGLDALAEAGRIVPFDAWRAGRPLQPPARPLDEAGRCADAILARGWCPPGARRVAAGTPPGEAAP